VLVAIRAFQPLEAVVEIANSRIQPERKRCGQGGAAILSNATMPSHRYAIFMVSYW
jgi:hypothetical protein